MGRLLAALAVLPFLTALPAAAQPGAQPGFVHVRYTGRALGLPVLKIDAVFGTDRAGYRFDLGFRTSGLLAFFVGANIQSTVQGAWAGMQPEPQRFWSSGELRGDTRQTLIDYRDGNPVVEKLVPPNKGEREEVPPAERQGTMDTMSAIAGLLHRVAETGACDSQARVYDGRRLTDMAAHTVGPVHLAQGEAGPWTGDELRCEFQGQQVAGFKLSDSAWARKPHHGTAWLARVVPGGPPVPVRLSFETRWVGDITLVLDEAGPGPLPQAPR